jgi:malonyl-CoA O-methyltransferase
LKKPSFEIDPQVARRRFERAAPTYAGASRLELEVGGRMLERLPYLRIAPRRILDAGSGPALDAAKLLARFRDAQVLALDFSVSILQSARKRFFEKRQFLAGDLLRLPFASGSIDFVWSNLAIHWTDPRAAFAEFARVLAPEGLLMFSTLGPDTLKELRAVAGEARVHRFVDMHDLGDLLVAAGFAAPVMDMEILTFTYSNAGQLLDDLRQSGQTNARRDRPRGLAGKGLRERIISGMEKQATFEVVYGHAWKGAARKLADGRDVVQFHSGSPRHS